MVTVGGLPAAHLSSAPSMFSLRLPLADVAVLDGAGALPPMSMALLCLWSARELQMQLEGTLC